ncbi:MAG: hypothetical protein K0S01_1703 [Herbinix sp.]|jgi:hypothetical protein|nr:hypothetical protein [Herbinix sp.]
MKKRLDIIFFSICFLTALIAETYCIQVLEGDLFSVVGIGVVVLITGYLLMDSIRSKWVKSNEQLKYYLGHVYSEETEKWNERYTEILNMQKATYTATKKNTAMLSGQLEEVVLRLETLETNNAKSLQKLIELQMKSLEGQKNGLNLELNYNKENTKQLIKVLREESNRFDLKEDLAKILLSLEENNIILKERISSFVTTKNEFDSEIGTRRETGFVQDFFDSGEENLTEDIYKEEIDTVDRIAAEVKEENANEDSWTDSPWAATAQMLDESDMQVDTVGDTESDAETDTVGDTETDTKADTGTYTGTYTGTETEIDAEVNTGIDKESDTATFIEADTQTDTVETEIVADVTDTLETETWMTDDLLNSLLSGSDTVIEEQKAATVAPAVVPLYDDPNKALTADEIAALFASFGQ